MTEGVSSITLHNPAPGAMLSLTISHISHSINHLRHYLQSAFGSPS
jgi:hypothetical protein